MKPTEDLVRAVWNSLVDEHGDGARRPLPTTIRQTLEAYHRVIATREPDPALVERVAQSMINTPLECLGAVDTRYWLNRARAAIRAVWGE